MTAILYTLKKSPLLRQLSIFGNRIGHPSAKVSILTFRYLARVASSLTSLGQLPTQARRIINCKKFCPRSQIIKRMLMSQVLNQENIDVRPYRVDHVWHFARYEGVRCRNDYQDVPYRLYVKPPEAPPPSVRSVRKYRKYTYDTMKEMKIEHVRCRYGIHWLLNND